MARTIDLRTAVRTVLLNKCQDVYFKRRKGEGFPYIVFDIIGVTDSEVLEQYELDVHLVDHGDNTETVENLTDNVWDYLDHYYHSDSSLTFAIYPSVRNTVDEEDKTIIHRRISATLKLFK